jgi:hypothetical protein
VSYRLDYAGTNVLIVDTAASCDRTASRYHIEVVRCVLLLGALMLLGCGGISNRVTAPPNGHAPAQAIDGWRITLSVRPSVVTPLVFSAGPVRAASRNEARVWVQHELVLENRSDRRLQFADTDTSAFIGARGTRRLIAADGNCGYAPQQGKWPLEVGVCLLSLDTFAIEPHGTVSRTITLFKGLRGMLPLTPGTYRFKKVFRFQVGDKAPAEGDGRSVVVSIDYQLSRS